MTPRLEKLLVSSLGRWTRVRATESFVTRSEIIPLRVIDTFTALDTLQHFEYTVEKKKQVFTNFTVGARGLKGKSRDDNSFEWKIVEATFLTHYFSWNRVAAASVSFYFSGNVSSNVKN